MNLFVAMDFSGVNSNDHDAVAGEGRGGGGREVLVFLAVFSGIGGLGVVDAHPESDGWRFATGRRRWQRSSTSGASKFWQSPCWVKAEKYAGVTIQILYYLYLEIYADNTQNRTLFGCYHCVYSQNTLGGGAVQYMRFLKLCPIYSNRSSKTPIDWKIYLKK